MSNKVGGKNAGTPIKLSDVKDNFNITSSVSLNSYSQTKIGTGLYDPKPLFYIGNDVSHDTHTWISASFQPNSDTNNPAGQLTNWIHKPYTPFSSDSDGITMKRMDPFQTQLSQSNPNRWQENTEYDPETRIRTYHISKDRNGICTNHFGHNNEFDYLFEHFGLEAEIRITTRNSQTFVSLYLRSRVGEVTFYTESSDDFTTFPYNDNRTNSNTVNMLGVKFPFLYNNEAPANESIPDVFKTGTKEADRYDEVRATDVNNLNTFTWGGPVLHDGGEYLQADGDPAYVTIPADGSWKQITETHIIVSQLRYEYLGGTTFPRYEYPHQPERNETSSDIKGFMLAGVTKVEHKLPSDDEAKKVKVERFTDAGMKQGEVRKVFTWDHGSTNGSYLEPLDIYKTGLDYSGDVGHTTAVFILKADFSQMPVAENFVNNFESNYGVPQIISSENTENPFSLPNKQVVWAPDRDVNVGTGVIMAYWGNVPESALNNNSRDNVFSLGDPYINVQTTNHSERTTSIPGLGVPPAMQASLYFLVGVNGDDDQVIIKSYADDDTPRSVQSENVSGDFCNVPDDAKVISLNDQFHSGSYCTIGAVASDVQTDVSTMVNLSDLTIGGDLYELTSEESTYASNNGSVHAKMFTETDTSDNITSFTYTSTYNKDPESLPFISGYQTTAGGLFSDVSSTIGGTFDTSGGGAYLGGLINIGKYPRRDINHTNADGDHAAEDLGLRIVRSKPGTNYDSTYWPSQGAHVALNPMAEHIYDNPLKKDMRRQYENGGTTNYWRSGSFDAYLSDFSIGCDAHSIFHENYPSRYRPVSRYANTMLTLSFKWDIQRYRPPLHPQTFLAVNNRERVDSDPHVIHFGSQVESKYTLNHGREVPTGLTPTSAANSGFGAHRHTPGAHNKFKALKDIPVMFETEFYSPYGFPSKKLPYFSGYGIDSRNVDHEGWWLSNERMYENDAILEDSYPSDDIRMHGDGFGAASKGHQGQLAEAKAFGAGAYFGPLNYSDNDQPYGDFIDLGYTFRIVCVDKDPLDDDCPIYELYISNGGSLMNFEYPDGTYCRTVFNELREDNDFLLKGTESVLDNNGKRIERLVSRFKPAREPGGDGDIADQKWQMFSVTLQDHTEYPRNEILFDKYAQDTDLLDSNTALDNRMSLRKDENVSFSEIAEFHGEPIFTDVSLRFEDYPDLDPTYQATHDRLDDNATSFQKIAQAWVDYTDRGQYRYSILGGLASNLTYGWVSMGIAPEVHYKADGTRGLRFRSTDGKRKQFQFGNVNYNVEDGYLLARNFYYPTNTDIWVRFKDPNGDLDSSVDAFVRIASQDIGQAGFTIIDVPAEGYSETLLFTDTSAGPSEANYNLYGFYDVKAANIELVNSDVTGREALTEEPSSETTYNPDVTILNDFTTIHGFKSLNQDFRGDNVGDSGPFDYNNAANSVSDGTNPNRDQDADGEVHLSSVKILTDADHEGFGNKDKYGNRTTYARPIRIGNQIGAQVGGKIVTRFAYNHPDDDGEGITGFGEVGSEHWGYDGKRYKPMTLELGAPSKFERVHSLRIHGFQPVDDSAIGTTGLNLAQNNMIDEIFFRTKFQGLITYPTNFRYFIQRLEDDTLVFRGSKFANPDSSGTPRFPYGDKKGGNSTNSSRTQIYVEIGDIVDLMYMPEIPNDESAYDQEDYLRSNFDNSEISTTDFLIVKSSKTGGDIDIDDMDANPLGIGMSYPEHEDPRVPYTRASYHKDYGHRIYKSNSVEDYYFDTNLNKTGMLRWDTQFTPPGTYYIVYSGTDSSVDPETAYLEVVIAERGDT